MIVRLKSAVTMILIAFSLVAPWPGVLLAQTAGESATKGPMILNRDEASAILPPSVYFRGKSASIQGRNSSGLRFPGGALTLATMVDTSGYSSAIQQTYQAYLLTDVSVLIGGQRLAAGAYGFGFLPGNTMTVMDLGGKEILHASTTRDDALARPNPLQILPGAKSGEFRLYLGRSYVTLQSAGN